MSDRAQLESNLIESRHMAQVWDGRVREAQAQAAHWRRQIDRFTAEIRRHDEREQGKRR